MIKQAILGSLGPISKVDKLNKIKPKCFFFLKLTFYNFRKFGSPPLVTGLIRVQHTSCEITYVIMLLLQKYAAAYSTAKGFLFILLPYCFYDELYNDRVSSRLGCWKSPGSAVMDLTLPTQTMIPKASPVLWVSYTHL